MRRSHREGLRRGAPAAFAVLVIAFVATLAAAGCGTGDGESAKNPADVRAARRAYDGAPPVAPHEDFGITCTECHNQRGMEVKDVGFAPPSPHVVTGEMSSIGRCRQCHVFRQTEAVFVVNDFVGLRQDLRRGPRLNPLAPPTIPHKTFMRENCRACHTGVAAREQIRTPHPERIRCAQCHVPTRTRAEFSTAFGPGS